MQHAAGLSSFCVLRAPVGVDGDLWRRTLPHATVSLGFGPPRLWQHGGEIKSRGASESLFLSHMATAPSERFWKPEVGGSWVEEHRGEDGDTFKQSLTFPESQQADGTQNRGPALCSWLVGTTTLAGAAVTKRTSLVSGCEQRERWRMTSLAWSACGPTP